MDRSTFEAWLEGYRRAWTSDDPDDIAALFTEEASYSPWPFRKPWEGRHKIVEKWLERGDSKRAWEFEHEVLAVEGDTGVVRGLTHYPAEGDQPEETYSNVFLVRVDPDGRAREFAEWWIEKPHDRPAS